MRTSFAILLLLALALSACSGGAYLSRYRMTAPVASDASVYEDADMKVSLGIVKDRKFSVFVLNKTAGPMLLIWDNSTIVDVSGVAGGLKCEVDDKQATHSGAECTTLKPGGTVRATVYPADHAYTDGRGVEGVHPLYFNGSKPGKPKDIEGRAVGVNLVLEVNGHSRKMPFMLKAEPSVFGH